MRHGLGSLVGVLCSAYCSTTAWVSPTAFSRVTQVRGTSRTCLNSAEGNLHGQESCFLPLQQLDQDYYAPRIVQIAGSYPGLTKEDFFAVSSEPPAEVGQWMYDFSDPEGPQMGTVAIEGRNSIGSCEDPVVIIAEHPSLGVELPPVIKDPVDIVVLVDRAANTFKERTFLVLEKPSSGLDIRAFEAKTDLPEGSQILGQVVLVQIPWLPSMKPTKSGFMEEDEYF